MFARIKADVFAFRVDKLVNPRRRSAGTDRDCARGFLPQMLGYQFEIVRLCALWDSPDLDKEILRR